MADLDLDHSNMKDELSRVSTFSNWPNPSISPGELASAGFFYLGPNDRVMCAFCNLKLFNFQKGEIPMEEHRRYKPNCPFVQMYPTKIELLSSQSEKDTCSAQLERRSSDSSVAEEDDPTIPRYPAYNEAARLQSFENSSWPRSSVHQTPEQFAEAGFFYTGESDRVRCFFCGAGLRGWEPEDDPLEEHEKWFPDCLYLKHRVLKRQSNTLKSQGYAILSPSDSHSKSSASTSLHNQYSTAQQFPVRTQLSCPAQLVTPQSLFGGQQASVYQSQLSTSTSNSIRSTDSEVESQQEIERLKEEKICKICMEIERNVTFTPCGHFVCCEGCGRQIRLCPICRQSIESVVKTYLS